MLDNSCKNRKQLVAIQSLPKHRTSENTIVICKPHEAKHSLAQKGASCKGENEVDNLKHLLGTDLQRVNACRRRMHHLFKKLMQGLVWTRSCMKPGYCTVQNTTK